MRKELCRRGERFILDVMRVLAVDDDADLLEVLQLALEQHGFDVVTASTLAAAEAHLTAAEPFDAVLTDLSVERHDDGLTLCREVRERAPDVGVLLLTGEASMGERARNAGAHGWLVKPVDIEQLIAALRRFERR
jgi:DNA-binding response OmpR family regulator